jgi:hypothetical protein
MIKNPSKHERNFIRQDSKFPSPVATDLQLDDYAGKNARDHWWTNQKFPLSISFHHVFPYSYITWG